MSMFCLIKVNKQEMPYLSYYDKHSLLKGLV